MAQNFIELGSSSSDEDDDVDDSMDMFDINLYSDDVKKMARDEMDPEFHDPANQAVLKQVDTLWRVFPQPRPPRLSPLLSGILRAKSETMKVNVIDEAWRALPSTEIGAPVALSRAEGFQVVRTFARMTSLLARGRAVDLFDIRSRPAGYAPVHPSAALQLLDKGSWVNDEIVDAFGALLEEYLDHDGTRVTYLPAFVWKDHPPYSNLRKILGPQHGDFLRASKYLLAPVHRNSHWAVVVAELATGEFFFYNSYSAGWSAFCDQDLLTRFGVFIECLRAQVPTVPDTVTPKRVALYPTQFDFTTCALYAMHCMESVASATSEIQFQQKTRDDKADQLRLHVFTCLIRRRWRPLRVSLPHDDNDDDDALMSDDVMDDDAPVRYDFGACSTCGVTDEQLFVCLPWHLAFCSVACQSEHAKTHHLHY